MCVRGESEREKREGTATNLFAVPLFFFSLFYSVHDRERKRIGKRRGQRRVGAQYIQYDKERKKFTLLHWYSHHDWSLA